MNKVETRVEAFWDLQNSPSFTETEKGRLRAALRPRLDAAGALHVTSQRHRSQARNREAAITRLRALVLEALRPRRVRQTTKPTAASEERRLEEKRRRARAKRARGAVQDQE